MTAPAQPAQRIGAGLPLREAAAVGAALEAAAGQAFALANREGQQARPLPYALTMSALGACARQAAYRLADEPPTDPGLALDQEARQAMIGVWIHQGFLPHLARVLGDAEIEVPVELRVEVRTASGARRTVAVTGRADCYRQAHGGGVIDLKTLRAYLLGEVDHEGVADGHRVQVCGYAAALRRAGYAVAWVAWLYMDRASGEVRAVVEPFGDAEEEQTVERVQWLHDRAQEPSLAPRGERGPGLSVACDQCPWLRACWGPDAEPGDAGALQVHDRSEIALAARRYKELGDAIGRLEKEQELWGAMVGRPQAGVYGPMQITYGSPQERLKEREAVKLMRESGMEPPMARRRGSRFIRWNDKSAT